MTISLTPIYSDSKLRVEQAERYPGSGEPSTGGNISHPAECQVQQDGVGVDLHRHSVQVTIYQVWIQMGLVKFPTHTPHFFIVLDTIGILLGYGETNSVWQNFSEYPTK